MTFRLSLSSPRDRRNLIDVAVRILLGLFFAFTAGTCIKGALGEFQHAGQASLVSHALSVLAIGLYTLMIAALYVLRFKPSNKFAGVWPSLAALLGGFLMMGLVWLPPRFDLPIGVQLLASLLVLSGNGLAMYILTHLGRSFSILPESRKLVTKGPYRYVRHPLYLAEALATLGAMIAFLSPLAVALVIAQFGFQLVRIHYEERVLRKSFPPYAAYAKRTARLLPGIY